MMTKRLKNGVVFVLFGFLTALLFFPMVRNGNQPKVQVVTEVGKVDKTFIRQLAPHAKRLGKAYGVRPSVLLAQAALETDYGRSLLGNKYHNLYGLALSEGQGVTVLLEGAGKTKAETKTYQVYSSWEASLSDYLVRLKAGQLGKKSLYADLVHAKTVEQATKSLVDGGFREDKTYASKLQAIIKEQKLEQYDKD